ncbi:hypothetical protein [Wenjunlia tyrosinilytica]|uniref:Uncharacterized protein n=1 Tax=Wenjunlia tyrosinilytica TaxID=1544741 RepID=A0A917ZNR5_9ACTN|nr:hypothetical protein [Wenjunlia tyrosinilytica]GGO86621.1 hypothetical protein GCM10012280_23180 [Wenjunlia tyrosinilytica]
MAQGDALSREETAALVRQLIKATGLPLRQLAKSTAYSAQSWSAFQRDERPVPAEALEALVTVPSTSPALLEEAERVLERMRAKPTAESAPAPPATEPLSPPTDPVPRAAPADPVPQAAPADPVPRAARAARSVARPPRRGVRPRTAGVAVAVAVVAACAAGVFALTQMREDKADDRRTPSPAAGHPTCQGVHYTVDRPGNVLDANGRTIGRVVPGDRFTRDDSPAHPFRQYRYYGTVPDRHVAGYVMQEKLTLTCT